MKIIKAGNDCADFSYGEYTIENSILTNCGDKAISIGEKSNMNINYSKLKNSQIGLSIKDFSKLSSKWIETDNVSLCLEVKHKKQEFGGAVAQISKFSCNSKFYNDQNSTISKLNELS